MDRPPGVVVTPTAEFPVDVSPGIMPVTPRTPITAGPPAPGTAGPGTDITVDPEDPPLPAAKRAVVVSPSFDLQSTVAFANACLSFGHFFFGERHLVYFLWEMRGTNSWCALLSLVSILCPR